MSSVRQLILDDLAASLEDISVANDYNNTIMKVVSGRILPSEKLRPDWRSIACQIRYDGQTNERDSRLADAHGMSSIVRFVCFATMANTTHETFMNFLDDVEASISKDPSRGDLDDTAYNVMDTWISEIDLMDTEEYDEVESSGDHKDFEAIIVINVEYLYIAELLSG